MIAFIKKLVGLVKPFQPIVVTPKNPDLMLEYIKEMGRNRFNIPEDLDSDIIPGVEIVDPGDMYRDDKYYIINNSKSPLHIRKDK